MTPTIRARAGAALPCVAALATLVAVAACAGGEGGPTGFAADTAPPSLQVAGVANAPDSVLAFQVSAADNLDLKALHVDVGAPVGVVRDTTLPVGTTASTVAFRIAIPRTVTAGTPVAVRVRATDGAGNRRQVDTTLAIGNVPAPTATIAAPQAGSPLVVGRSSGLAIAATSPLGVVRVGWRATGAFTAADSAEVDGVPRPRAWQHDGLLAVPAGATPGIVTVTPFVVDSVGRRVNGAPVQFAVQTAPGAATRPVVRVTGGTRIEVSDSLAVSVTDQAGVAFVGYRLYTPSGHLEWSDSVAVGGTLVNVQRRLGLEVPPWAALPLLVRGFAVNAAGVHDTVTAAARADTVVAGLTLALPEGGRVADALYHPRWDRLYLSNVEQNAIEVFDVANRRFLRDIPLYSGSRPWGMAVWPRHRPTSPDPVEVGSAMGDTLLVANSGGTDVSLINLATGREVDRYPLPNIVAYSVTTAATSAGVRFRQATVYDFSDRPQFLATTCGGNPWTSDCVDPILVYSTAPTGGQTLPFPNMGSVRWENLRTRTSHFFFEQATGQTTGRADTLRIVRYAAAAQRMAHPGDPDSTVLVDDEEKVRNLRGDSAIYAITVDVPKLGFTDTTFLRSSGNFARAVLGEGGRTLGSRVMTYDASLGMLPSYQDRDGMTWHFDRPVIDRGISPAFAVRDAIANLNTFVRGVAINFDGSLAAVRADSTYLIDPTLRLQGILPSTGGVNAGFDFHPANMGRQGGPLTRLAFSASAAAQIDVFDTWCYRKVATLLVRDPIIGPIRAATRPDGTAAVLVGASARGVVVVPLPASVLTGGCG